MNITRHDFDFLQYLLQPLLGVSWVILALFMFYRPHPNLLFDTIPAIILTIAGLSCIILGVEAYLLREDPEIWD